MNAVPTARIRTLNDAALNPAGSFVLYWMTMNRRTRSNFALQRAVEIAVELRRPLVILEALRCDYPWASDRLHRFVIDGMADNARACRGRRVLYYPYVEPREGRGRGLLRTLSADACAVVTDWYPSFFLPRMTAAAARQIDVGLEAVDSTGLIPVSCHERAFPTARGYRAFMQRELRAHLAAWPDRDPLARLRSVPVLRSLPPSIAKRWPAASKALLGGDPAALRALPIDHDVAPVGTRGGATAAARTLRRFVTRSLGSYADDHHHPDADATSHLSPYLHFGHISTHEVFSTVMTAERWTTRKLAARGGGSRSGWWGVSASAEAFLDQLVVWRELAFNGAAWIQGYGSYEALPAWARGTLEKHQRDRRDHVYSRDALERAATGDDVWNAVQRQLVADGWFHGYLRMLWGKKILEWTPTPSDAIGRMEHLMNRYALDGRDPVSYAGYAWVLGLYDRPWPERPIFGTVRCMTSASTKRKLRMTSYLERYGATSSSRVPRRTRPADRRPGR